MYKVNSGYVLQNNKSLAAMKVLVLATQTIILFVTLLGFTAASLGDCPPWSFPDTVNSTRCVCSSVEADAVKCSEGTTLLSTSHCMTYSSTTGDTEVGPYPYVSQHINLSSDLSFFLLPNHTSNLTSFMCGSLHRTGVLCGECEEGFGPAYTLAGVQDVQGAWRWVACISPSQLYQQQF